MSSNGDSVAGRAAFQGKGSAGAKPQCRVSAASKQGRVSQEEQGGRMGLAAGPICSVFWAVRLVLLSHWEQCSDVTTGYSGGRK